MAVYYKKEVRDRVIREIWEKGPLTRLQIEEISGLSNSYNHILIRSLLKKGIICRESSISIPRGRKPYLYSVNPKIGYIAGVEIDDKRVIIMISDFALTSFKKFSYTIKASPSTMIEDTARLIKRSLDNCGVALQKLRGVGLGLHGIVDFSSSTLVKFHQTLEPVNIPIRDGLEEKLKIPVFIEDNNRAAVLAEKKFGQAKDAENFLYVRVSSGVGMGIWINGECYRGDTGLAGEIGHIIIKRNGPSCYCGNFGCLETFISNDALCKLAIKRLKDGVESKLRDKWKEGKGQLEISDIVDAGVEGDKLAYEIIRETGEALGHALAIAVNILNVEMIILDGELTRAGNIFMYPIMQVLRSEAIQQSANHVRIIFSKLGDESVARGALVLALNEIFKQPGKYIVEKVS